MTTAERVSKPDSVAALEGGLRRAEPGRLRQRRVLRSDQGGR